MDLQLRDQVIVIGGASRGIGYAIAAAFLDEGAKVAISGRDNVSLDHAAMTLGRSCEDRIMALAGDLSSRDFCQRLVDTARAKWGRVDCAVANAGSGRGTTGWKIPTTEWDSMLQTNLLTGLYLVEAALPAMVAAGTGNVILIGSIAGRESIGAPIAYAVAKSALASYSKNLARTVGNHGIRVNCIEPGNVLFPGGTWDRKQQENPAMVQDMLAREVPLRRFATPEEIAGLAIFLASPRAAFVTGACIVADGGQTRGVS